MDNDSRAGVLYVDDEALACKYFARAVGARYRVLTAHSVDAALAMLKDESANIDVLVHRLPHAGPAWAASCCRKWRSTIRTSSACSSPPTRTRTCCSN